MFVRSPPGDSNAGRRTPEPKVPADPPRPEDERARAERFVADILPRDQVLRVLAVEAGDQFAVRAPAYVVGGDVRQAERSPRPHADERRAIDLDRMNVETGEYDVVLFVNVLEHARKPLSLFPTAWSALKDGGLFVLVLPNVASVKGLLARFMPWRFQRWFYARILRSSSVPARSIHSYSLRPSSLLAHARAGGWKVEYFRLYEGGVQRSVRQRLRLVGWRWRFVVVAIHLATFGLLTAEETGIILVLSR